MVEEEKEVISDGKLSDITKKLFIEALYSFFRFLYGSFSSNNNITANIAPTLRLFIADAILNLARQIKFSPGPS